MTNLAYYTKRIQDCFDANSSWNGDLTAALALYTMGGDWNAQVDWIPELLAEQTGQDFDQDDIELVTEEWDLEEMAETALTDWVEANAVDNFFDDVPCYMPLYKMDADERNQLLLQHATAKGCSWKAWTFLLSEDTDWLYYGDTGMDVETTIQRANAMVAQAIEDNSDDMDIALLNEFIEQYTEENA